MAWQDEVLIFIRVLISDLDEPYTYSDNRLTQLAVVSAHIVKNEVPLNYSYSVTISTNTITPDPTTNNDTAFMNLISLKSACLADWSIYRTEALRSGIKAKLGPGTFETVQRLPGFAELINSGPCASYEKLKMQWSFGGASAARVILSPFVSNDFDPTSLGNYGGGIERMLG